MSAGVIQIENIIDEIQKIFEIEAKRQKHGEMNLLSMFRHGYENSHSDTIAYLLNPRANHRHGSEYLEKFLNATFGDKFLNKSLEKVNVYRERHRIDILIEHEDFAIIIENKIYAGDQDSQLLRYYDEIIKNYTDDKIHILYLTLDGHEPSEQSYTRDDKTIIEYQCVSYAFDILSWLKRLTFTSNEHSLRSAIEQYIFALENLTGANKKGYRNDRTNS